MITADQLTLDQQNALRVFKDFLVQPDKPALVIQGGAGCGKSALVPSLLDAIKAQFDLDRLVDPDTMNQKVFLTATTNKAASNLTQIVGRPVQTIHSLLGLRLQSDGSNGTNLVQCRQCPISVDSVVFVDEAGMIDGFLYKYLKPFFKIAKFVFMGDPDQLLPIKAARSLVFDLKVPKVSLETTVRQKENSKILDLATKFRRTVRTGDWFQIVPDGVDVEHLPRSQLLSTALQEFGRPDWKFHNSKILTWTNNVAVSYNRYLLDRLTGSPDLRAGDYAVCNAYFSYGKKRVRTDEIVLVEQIEGYSEDLHGIACRRGYLDNGVAFLLPESWEHSRQIMKLCKSLGTDQSLRALEEIQERCIDLRAAYAQTVNKSQGSTYDTVFVDLDDISKCRNGNQLARLLYVAVSRARKKVYLTGDLA